MKDIQRTQISLPPYGVLSQQYQEILSNDPMDDWHSSEKDWENFICGTTSQISNHLWPKFHKDTVNWSGEAADHCVDATEKEIEIVKTTELTNKEGTQVFCVVKKKIYIADKKYYKQKRKARVLK